MEKEDLWKMGTDNYILALELRDKFVTSIATTDNIRSQ